MAFTTRSDVLCASRPASSSPGLRNCSFNSSLSSASTGRPGAFGGGCFRKRQENIVPDLPEVIEVLQSAFDRPLTVDELVRLLASDCFVKRLIEFLPNLPRIIATLKSAFARPLTVNELVTLLASGSFVRRLIEFLPDLPRIISTLQTPFDRPLAVAELVRLLSSRGLAPRLKGLLPYLSEIVMTLQHAFSGLGLLVDDVVRILDRWATRLGAILPELPQIINKLKILHGGDLNVLVVTTYINNNMYQFPITQYIPGPINTSILRS